MAEIGALVEAGVVALSDMPRPIENTALLKRALEYCGMFDRPLLEHPEILSLSRLGVMHEDMTQLVIGLSPMPAEAEDLATARDLRLVEATGGRLHLTNISTVGSVELCSRAKSRGLPFTVGINSANFHLLDHQLRSFDSNCKINPPMRSEEHLQACLAALADGTIDVIATGHRPCSVEKKMQELDAAPFGMISLETTLSAVVTHLIRPKRLGWRDAIAKLTVNPAKVLGLASGTLTIGSAADVVVIDPEVQWKVDANELLSKASNTPLHNQSMFGRAVMTFVDGKCKFSRLAAAT
jgi:dihydroorotase